MPKIQKIINLHTRVIHMHIYIVWTVVHVHIYMSLFVSGESKRA